jgi:hypothetical protein
LASTQARFQGRPDCGDGEFGRALRELLHSGFFKPPVISAPQPRYGRPSRIRDQAAIE